MKKIASQKKIDSAFTYFLQKKIHYNDKGNFETVDVNMVFNDFKRISYDSQNYKWSLKECLSFLNQIPNLGTHEFINILIELKDEYYSHRKKRGKIGLEKFIHRLESSKKFMQSKYEFYGIKLKDNKVTYEFIRDLKQLHKHLNISQNDFVKFVFKNFKTELTESTLRRYYYDETK